MEDIENLGRPRFKFVVRFTGFPVQRRQNTPRHVVALKWGKMRSRFFTVRAFDSHHATDMVRMLVAKDETLKDLFRPTYRIASVDE
jgi:hypothetical protein